MPCLPPRRHLAAAVLLLTGVAAAQAGEVYGSVGFPGVMLGYAHPCRASFRRACRLCDAGHPHEADRRRRHPLRCQAQHQPRGLLRRRVPLCRRVPHHRRPDRQQLQDAPGWLGRGRQHHRGRQHLPDHRSRWHRGRHQVPAHHALPGHRLGSSGRQRLARGLRHRRHVRQAQGHHHHHRAACWPATPPRPTWTRKWRNSTRRPTRSNSSRRSR